MGLNNFRTEHLIWDRVNSHITYSLETNSGDSNGRKLRVQVLDGGVVTALTGVTLSLAWKTANGRYSGLDAFKVADAALGIFEIYYTTEMLSNVGKLKASLVLVDATGRMESDTFPIVVKPTMVDDNAVQGENSFTALTEALISVTDLEKNYAPKLNEVTAQLAQKATKNELFFKRDKATKIEPTDASDALLQMFSPAGSTSPIVAPNSVDANKTTFIREQKNIFNKSTVVNGYINFLTGAVTSSELYKASDYIPVIYGRIYKTTKCYDYAFYNSSKTFISAVSNGNVEATVTPPTNAVFMRTSVANANLNTTMISEYSLPTEYLAFGERKILMIDEAFISAIKETVPQPTDPFVESKWKNKVWNVLGDSITEVNGTANMKYHDVIKAKIGCTVNNYGISGTGWRTPDSGGGKLGFYQRINTLTTDADLITVFGGTNDWSEVGIPMVLGTFGDSDPAISLYGAIDYTLRQLVIKFPTKTIAVFTPIQRNNNWLDHNSNGVTLEMVADAIIKVANKYSIPVLDLYREGNMYAWDANFRTAMLQDGLHPNNAGHANMADKILAFINSL